MRDVVNHDRNTRQSGVFSMMSKDLKASLKDGGDKRMIYYTENTGGMDPERVRPLTVAQFARRAGPSRPVKVTLLIEKKEVAEDNESDDDDDDFI